MKRLLFLFTVTLVSCVSKKEEGPVISDATLYSLAGGLSSFTYFRNSMDTLATHPESPHGSYIRVRFNPKALTALDDSAAQLVSASFPEESMIVKEVYFNSGGPLRRYVVMYKKEASANSNGGWVWNEMEPDGDVIYSASSNGTACISCHRDQPNADHVRTLLLH